MTRRERGKSVVVLSIDSVVENDLGIYFCVAYAYVELGKIVGHCRIWYPRDPCIMGDKQGWCLQY